MLLNMLLDSTPKKLWKKVLKPWYTWAHCCPQRAQRFRQRVEMSEKRCLPDSGSQPEDSEVLGSTFMWGNWFRFRKITRYDGLAIRHPYVQRGRSGMDSSPSHFKPHGSTVRAYFPEWETSTMPCHNQKELDPRRTLVIAVWIVHDCATT
jgi:hypothetical protein